MRRLGRSSRASGDRGDGGSDDQLASYMTGFGLLQRRHRFLERIDLFEDHPDVSVGDCCQQLGHVPAGVGAMHDVLNSDLALRFEGVAGDGYDTPPWRTTNWLGTRVPGWIASAASTPPGTHGLTCSCQSGAV